MTTLKKVYDEFLKSGDLLELFPQMTGVWNKDKFLFQEQYEENIKSITESDVFDDEYDVEDFDD